MSYQPETRLAGLSDQTRRRNTCGCGSRQRGHFIRGPIPWEWLCRAGRTVGKGLHVAAVIWFKVGLQSSDRVKISLSAVARYFNFDRASAARGLAELENAGLVVVERHSGAAALVRVVRECPDVSSGPSEAPLRVQDRDGDSGPQVSDRRQVSSA